MKANHELKDATDSAIDLQKILLACNHVDDVIIAGSVRRHKAIVGDIDLVVVTDQTPAVADHLRQCGLFDEILCAGKSKLAGMIDGMQVDIRFTTEHWYGAMLAHCTGPAEHNIAMRSRAKKLGLRLNEYGVFDPKTGEILASSTEQEIFAALGLNFIPPELRGTSLSHYVTAPKSLAN